MKPALFRATRGGGQRQGGVSLISTLLFTTATLLLGVSVMGINVMQERMVGNSRDRDLAFQAAEAALRDAESDIINNIPPDSAWSDSCAQGLCTAPSQRTLTSALRALPVEQQPGFSWASEANTRTYGEFTAEKDFPLVASPPRYVVEYLGEMAKPLGEGGLMGGVGGGDDTPPRIAYRITARAIGARLETVVTLQSIYYRR